MAWTAQKMRRFKATRETIVWTHFPNLEPIFLTCEPGPEGIMILQQEDIAEESGRDMLGVIHTFKKSDFKWKDINMDVSNDLWNSQKGTEEELIRAREWSEARERAG